MRARNLQWNYDSIHECLSYVENMCSHGRNKSQGFLIICLKAMLTSLPNPLQRTWRNAQPSSCLCSSCAHRSSSDLILAGLLWSSHCNCQNKLSPPDRAGSLLASSCISFHPVIHTQAFHHEPQMLSQPQSHPNTSWSISTVLVYATIPQEEQSLSNLRPSMKYFNGCLNSVWLPYHLMET